MKKLTILIFIILVLGVLLITQGCVEDVPYNIDVRLNYNGNKVFIIQNFSKNNSTEYYRVVSYNLSSKEVQIIYTGQEYEIIEYILPSPKNDLLLFKAHNCLYLYDTATNRTIKKIEGTESNVCWAPDGNAFLYFKTGLELYQVRPDQELAAINSMPYIGKYYLCLAWSQDGNQVLLRDLESEFFVYNIKLNTKKILMFGKGSGIGEALFSQDGRFVIFAFFDKDGWKIKSMQLSNQLQTINYKTGDQFSETYQRIRRAGDNGVIFKDFKENKIYYLDITNNKLNDLAIPKFYDSLWDFNNTSEKLLIQRDILQCNNFTVFNKPF